MAARGRRAGGIVHHDLPVTREAPSDEKALRGSGAHPGAARACNRVSDGTDAAVPDAKPLDTGIDAESTDAASDAASRTCGHDGEPLCAFVTDAVFQGGFMPLVPSNAAAVWAPKAAMAKPTPGKKK